MNGNIKPPCWLSKIAADKIICLFFFIVFFSGAGGKGESPYGLMVEFIRQPQGVRILDPKPEFSWIVPPEAQYQTAYQIMISSSGELVQKNKPDVWNSGKVISSISCEAGYTGEKLPDNTTYFWIVRIWDKKGKPSPWSSPQSFTTGITGEYATTSNKFIETVTSPGKLLKTGEGSYFADFEKDAFGSLIIRIPPGSHDTLIIHLGEKSGGPGKVDANPGGTIRYHKILLALDPSKSEYLVFPVRDERNTAAAAIHLPDSFGIITPFRYCLIENCRQELKPEDLLRKAYSHYFEDDAGFFQCSDTILNQIWEISKYSIKATSFAGFYIDGDRERIPYEADAYINQLGHFCTDREYSLARRTNEYFITHPTWPTEWILQTVPLFYNDLMYTGNYESAGRYYHELQHKALVSLARSDGLISSTLMTDEIMRDLGFSNAKDRIRDIIDWPPSQKDTGWKLATPEGERDGYDLRDVNTVVNAFHYNNLIRLSELAGLLGKEADSALYCSRAEMVKASFNKVFLDKVHGYYIDGENSAHASLHANMMALAFGLVPGENIKAVTDFIKSRGMACSVYGAQYLLEGLYRAGEGDYAMDLLTATHDRSWWNMIRSGSTITMEAWDLKYKPNSDWNHAWGAAPANIIPSCMWGIVPEEPGFARAVIRPQLGKLEWSRVSMPTIRGNITCEFRKTGQRKEYFITVPGNMICNLILDDIQDLPVKINGKKLKSSTASLGLKPGMNKIIY